MASPLQYDALTCNLNSFNESDKPTVDLKMDLCHTPLKKCLRKFTIFYFFKKSDWLRFSVAN